MQHISTIAAVALILGACSQAAEPGTTVIVPVSTTTVAPATSSSTTTVVETITTIGVPSTTVEEPAIPYPDTSGDDWFKIVSEHYAFGGWLFENPDATLVAVIAVPLSDYESNIAVAVDEYVKNGWSDLPGGSGEVLDVTIERANPDEASLIVVDGFNGATTVDATGAIVRTVPARGPSAFRFSLRNLEGAWLIASIEPLGPVAGFDE
jgi:hypothetical protein